MVIAVVLLLVPILFILFSRRTQGGTAPSSLDKGMTHTEPSSDQPTPKAGPSASSERTPPG